MLNFQSSILLDELSTLTQEIIERSTKSFQKLTSKQRNWRPNSETWSLNEIFEHLNAHADFYNETLTKKIEKTRFDESKSIFVPSPLGRAAWKSIKLGNAKNVKRKFKAQREYNPTFNIELQNENALEDFIQNQNKMLVILNKARHVNLRKVKVPLAMSKVVRLRLGDCLMFVIYHNERHLYQALNLLKMRSFPQN